jgi:hypothetical protein
VTLHPKKSLDVSLGYDTVINTGQASVQQGNIRIGYLLSESLATGRPRAGWPCGKANRSAVDAAVLEAGLALLLSRSIR